MLVPGGLNAVHHSGTFYANIIISANTPNFDLHNAVISAGWNGVSQTNIVCTINSGISVGANNVSYSGFYSHGFPVGSLIKLINNGIIVGCGGTPGALKSGDGVGAGQYGNAGFGGGNALLISYNISIDNTNGYIYGGGGGGGSGAAGVDYGGAGGWGRGYTYSTLVASACLGNPGQYDPSYCPTPAQPGTLFGSNGDGSICTYGGGAGGNGGDYAGTGGAGGTGGATPASGGTGGAPGTAVVGNSYITWLGGNNTTHILGAIT